MHTSPAVVALTPNPALDVTLTLPRLKSGCTHRVSQGKYQLAGKGVNVATVASEQGYDAVALGPLSDRDRDYAAARGWLQHLDAAGVQQHWTDTSVAMRSTFAVVETEVGDVSMVNEVGDSHSEETWHGLCAAVKEELSVRRGSVLTISGSWPPSTPESLLPALIRIAHEADSTVVVDCGGPQLLSAAKAGADILKPNLAELIEALGGAAADNPFASAQQLQELGAGAVVISMGAEGLAYRGRGSFRARTDRPLRGNPTGAGDALVAALATGVLDSLDVRELLERAVRYSAAAVLNPAAGTIGDRWKEIVPIITEL
ncbi:MULTISPECIES: 1-phosphofructokinase family hexose kinase [Corynebacterium]|uniref:1-phosphofructokinase family hexose kinase n=1 Tax=Corynebacterium TaxID=1716 RepID=UPI00124BD601|nr:MULTISPECIES: PfkB family carbohydrate kinase [Corynebacterium]